MRKFEFMTCQMTGDIKIHKCGCRDIKKECVDNTWTVEDKDVKEAIAQVQQGFFEDCGGIGDFMQADPNEQESACSFANQSFYIVNCVK